MLDPSLPNSPPGNEVQLETVAPDHRPHVPSLEELVSSRLSRRAALCGLGTAVAAAAIPLGATANAIAGATAPPGLSSLKFKEVSHGIDERHRTAEGYSAQVVLRWGDPILPGAPPFDPAAQSATAQRGQFGYNNDYIAFMPLPRGSLTSDRGLLCVNHEYTVGQLMFPGYKDKVDSATRMTREQCEIEMAAHGHSVVEVERSGGEWRPVIDSKYNRRLTATTEMLISGPAAGSERLKTSRDPSGTRVTGTLNNCAGGVTPWGTVLSGEENFDGYFAGRVADCPDQQLAASELRNLARFNMAAKPSDYSWSRFHEQFRLEREPREPNRFGWVVEFDPYDPHSTPIKRTALGRIKHEGASCTLTPDGRVVVYTGDDARGEYIYKFVSSGRYDPQHLDRNRDLLDSGTLYVAQLRADGQLRWLPLVHGTGPLTSQNGFASQADVLIETRIAADYLRATPLDRPEDVEVNPVTGHVFAMLTYNELRKEPHPANPRVANIHGHILQLIPPVIDNRVDHGADEFRWEVFLLAGNPAIPQDGAQYHTGVSPNGWLSCPDNCTFDREGRLWIATDGAPYTGRFADAIYACDVNGPGRALTRQFFRGPTGAELTGPCFTPDGKTFFVSVQHPGDEELPDQKIRSTFDDPSTRWPDFDPRTPPRPSVVAIRKNNGEKIGG